MLDSQPPLHRNSLGYVVPERGSFEGSDQPMIVWGRNHNGEWISIADAKRGGDQGLRCECGSKLIARKGKKKAHHFAHASDGNGACSKAHLDALCRFALGALTKAPGLQLPHIQGKAVKTLIDTISVQQHSDFNWLCATVTSKNGARELALVITLKHRQQTPSADIFRTLGLSAITVDLAPYRNSDDHFLADALSAKAARRWIYNEKYKSQEYSESKNNQIYKANKRGKSFSKEKYDDMSIKELKIRLFGEDF